MLPVVLLAAEEFVGARAADYALLELDAPVLALAMSWSMYGPSYALKKQNMMNMTRLVRKKITPSRMSTQLGSAALPKHSKKQKR